MNTKHTLILQIPVEIKDFKEISVRDLSDLIDSFIQVFCEGNQTTVTEHGVISYTQSKEIYLTWKLQH